MRSPVYSRFGLCFGSRFGSCFGPRFGLGFGLCCGTAVSFAATAGGQQAPPTPLTVVTDLPAPVAGDTPLYTLQTNVREVNLDVVVTDAKGRPVRGLTRNDFKVLDQGKPQTLRSFTEHDLSTAAADPAFKPPPNTYTNYVSTGNRNTSFVLLFDSLDSPVDIQQRAFVAAKDFLKDLAPGTSVAIFGLYDRMNLLQGFTTDRDELLTALKDKRAQPRTSPLLGTGNEVLRQQVLNQGMLTLGRYLTGFPGRKNLIWFVVNIPGSFNSRTASLQATSPPGSLNGAGVAAPADPTASELATQNILQTETGSQSATNVVVLQGTGQNTALPPPQQGGQNDPNAQQDVTRTTLNTGNGNPFLALTNLIDDSQSTRDVLTLSRVVVYPVDPRQLMTPFEQAANPGYLFEQGAMKEVADATGGEAFVNRNGIASILQEIVAKGSDYYTLTYSPANIQWNGSFRKLKVETAGAASQKTALHLEYRPGYYAADRMLAGRPLTGSFTRTSGGGDDRFLLTSEGKGGQDAAALLSQSPRAGLQAAMTIGQAPPTELILAASLKPGAETVKVAKDGAMPEGNHLRDKFKHEPFRLYDVLFATDASALQLPVSPDGLRHGGVEFVAAVYTEDGDVVNSFKVSLDLNLDGATYRALLRAGLGTKRSLAIPVKGNYVVRLGVHDLNSDRIGALEFPMRSVLAGVTGAGQLGTP